ncbi:putative bifunctional diguanylate cyclase/phosphodiesterase [Thermobifida cellulosilytica]|uniref:Diguanylate cyclase n=1 Tax=Thermobifida cellulosilytica TB100 TaxID=665004 RepID=A0A147KIT3_THECS|nr:EAL domain-containing protein [Thermobifida cellulosilytica]KUP97203.1 diguanylate cyclase [Thermobifida cellulosilytica TB100]
MRGGARVRLGVILGLFLVYALGTLLQVGEVPLTVWAGTWPTAAAAAGAAAVLLHASRSRARADEGEDGGDGPDSASALRLFGLAALAWCAGSITYGVTGLLNAGAFSLTFGDLFSLVALPLFTLGFLRFAPLPHRTRALVRYVTDSYVCAAAVFSVVWLLLFQPLYQDLGDGAGVVAFALVYPVADIAVLCLLGPLVLTSPHSTRRAVLLATGTFVVICVADVIGAVGRLSGDAVAGGIEYPVRLLGFLLLGTLPWLVRRNAGARPRRITGRGLYRVAPEIAAVTALSLAALVMTVAGLRADGIAPVLPLVAGSAVLVLVVRMVGMMEESAVLARIAQTRERHLHELAEHSGDIIVILEEDGRIFYMSPGAVEMFGYRSGDPVLDRPVTSLVHPEDLPGLVAAVAGFRRGAESVRVRARVRAADGTWRHTTSTVSQYERPSEPNRYLLTTRDISAQVELQKQVDHLTFHDGVTGLPNRAYLEERVREVLGRRAEAAEEGQQPLETAVVFLDLDGFTAVNDSAGHAFGDYLLAQVGHRLRAVLGTGDTLARWGSDEFVALVEERPRADSVVDLAERMIRVIEGEPFQVAERDVVVTASVGVAFADPGVDGAELLRNADMAMALAKEQGGGHVEVYAAHMHAQVVERLELQTELRQALADRAFVLEYQPVVSLETSQVTAVEALVRWRRGDGVLVPPEEFIGPAEDSGLIVPLGQWILREACQKVAVWRATTGLDIGLSVNVSARQVLSQGFVQSVEEVLAESGLAAEALTVEVDEEILLENPVVAAERLTRLRGLGVRLAVDDFGMGHASLSHLRRLRVDAIKIDPSFVRELDSDDTVTLLTRTIIRLGQDLGVQVVAEGIEHPWQLRRLKEMGCAYGQGFLVGRPMDAAGVEALVGGEANATVR